MDSNVKLILLIVIITSAVSFGIIGGVYYRYKVQNESEQMALFKILSSSENDDALSEICQRFSSAKKCFKVDVNRDALKLKEIVILNGEGDEYTYVRKEGGDDPSSNQGTLTYESTGSSDLASATLSWQYGDQDQSFYLEASIWMPDSQYYRISNCRRGEDEESCHVLQLIDQSTFKDH